MLDKLDGQAIPSSRVNPPDIEIGEHFTVNGIAGCNRYFGQGHLEDDRLWVTSLGSTAMACPPRLDQVEQAVLATLMEGATLSGTPQTLILTGKQHRLEYRLRDWVY
ncbi:Heat shock protein HslJ [compost metagenome]